MNHPTPPPAQTPPTFTQPPWSTGISFGIRAKLTQSGWSARVEGRPGLYAIHPDTALDAAFRVACKYAGIKFGTGGPTIAAFKAVRLTSLSGFRWLGQIRDLGPSDLSDLNHPLLD